MGSIEVRYLNDEDEMVTAALESRNSTLPPAVRFVIPLFGLAGLIWTGVAVANLVTNPRVPEPLRWIGTAFDFLAGVFLWFLLFVLPVRFANIQRVQARKSPHLNQSVSWSIDGDRLRLVRPLAESILAWGFFLKVIQTSKGFLLFVNPRECFWLPFHGFESPDGPERFAALARDRVREFHVKVTGGLRRPPQAATMFDPSDRS